MKKWPIVISSIFSLMIVSESMSVKAVEPIKEVKSLVKQVYYPNISTERLKQSKTIEQLMKKLDPYSMYMTNAEMKAFEADIAMEFVGIGVVIISHKKGLEIVEVITGSPASKAGLKVGEIITKVNGVSLAGKKEDEATSMLKGKAKTAVRVSVLNVKFQKEYSRNLIRKKVTMKNVESKKLAGGVGYLRLNSFSEKSAQELQAAMKKMPNTKRWIFDLRGNSGGYIEAAEAIIGMFPNAEYAYAQKYAHEDTYYLQLPKTQKTQFKGSVALLVDKNSASASEMTAGAVKGKHLATIYGQKTFGKGVAQSVFQLANNKGYVKLTTSEFYAIKSNGNLLKINKVGISPDVKTVVGQEVIVSHGAFLKKKFQKGIKLSSQLIDPNKQKIIVKPSKNMSWNQLKSADIRLYQLGGVTRKITLNKSGKQVIITAPKGMKKGTKYYLNIKPTKGKSAYSFIRVVNK